MNLKTSIWIVKALLGLAQKIPAKKDLPVLVVEDNHFDAHLIQAVLKKIGLTSVVVPGPQAARAMLANGKFQMMILDISFPDGNGVDFANEIYDDYSDLPVLFLTGHMPAIVIGKDEPRILGPGRVWLISAKGVEPGSLANTLKFAARISNGVNGHVPLQSLAVVTWTLCTLTGGMVWLACKFPQLLENLIK